MRFLSAIGEALLNRSAEELIGALIVAAATAGVAAGVYAFGRRIAPPSLTFVGSLVLAAGVSCMMIVAGYIDYEQSAGSSAGSVSHRPPFLGAPPMAGAGQNPTPGPWGYVGGGWSAGFQIVVAADEDHNGTVSAIEAAELVRKADSNGDAMADFRDIDRFIMSRLRPPVMPAQEKAETRIGIDVPPNGSRQPPRNPLNDKSGRPSSPDTDTTSELD